MTRVELGVVKGDAAVAGRLHDGGVLHIATLERNGGGKLDPRVVNGATLVYNVFRKAYFVTGQTEGYLTYFDLAQSLYPDIYDGKDAERKRPAIYNQLRRLDAAGLLRTRPHRSDAGQILGLWWGLVDEEPDPMAWPDLKYSVARYPEKAEHHVHSSADRRGGCEIELKRRKRPRRGDPSVRVHPWNPRVGHGSAGRFDVVGPFFSTETFCRATSLPTPKRTTSSFGGGQAVTEVGERRAHAPARPRPWAALDRCRTAASGGVPLAVLAVPRAGWPAMAVAAFEARFLADAAGSWWAVGDPYAGPLGYRETTAQHDGNDTELMPYGGSTPPGGYPTLSGPWTRRLETWCRVYDRAVREPGAGIRSVIDDIVGWAPEDGAAGRAGDPGWPVGPAFFVARLGRRAKGLRRQQQPRRRTNSLDWAAGERWTSAPRPGRAPARGDRP